MTDEPQKQRQDSWQDKYFGVIFELDRARLPERVKDAEEAMSKRSYELSEDLEHAAERLLLVKLPAPTPVL